MSTKIFSVLSCLKENPLFWIPILVWKFDHTTSDDTTNILYFKNVFQLNEKILFSLFWQHDKLQSVS